MASLPSQSTAPNRIRQSERRESGSSLTDIGDHAERDLGRSEQDIEHDTTDRQEEEEEDTGTPVFPSPRSPSFRKSTIASAPSDLRDTMTEDSQGGQDEEASQISPAIPPPTNSPSDDDEPRKCWICYTDETEDSPLNKEWRSPCPCALNAHEACLLDWLADMENPKTRKDNGREAQMLCPQCKSEIVIARPRSLVVDFVRAVESVAGRLVLPGMAFTLAGTLWAGCCAHGVYSMYLIFGKEDATLMLEGASHGTWNPRLNLGLPLIPLALIFSKTRYAEGLLPAIPVLFFATHHPYSPEMDLEIWPPSAAMTFAALPYAKSFYKFLYDRVFGKLERKWIAEVQPRAGEDEDRAAGAGQHVLNDDNHQNPEHEAMNHDENAEILMEIELQVGIGNVQHQEEAHVPQQQGGAADQAAGQNNVDGPAGQILGRRQDDIIHETSTLADTILGALLFPAVSASMGSALKWALPKTWTILPTNLEKSRAGLLQTRWGRSVVGGCVFVLLKDAIILYCRWKLAQSHRRRRVLNYDRSKKRVVTP